MCFNSGKHNYNDFGAKEFESVLNTLKTDLNIIPSNMYLLNLEWGFNIEIKIKKCHVFNKKLRTIQLCNL